MTREWALFYASWMIGDGCPDRKVGEVFDWLGIEFWTENGLEKADAGSKSADLVADFKYVIFAEVTYLSDQDCVIDFELKAIGTPDLLPAGCKVGDYVTGEIVLSFPLSTQILSDEGLKLSRRTWRVNKIQADLTPFIQFAGDPRSFHRDNSRVRHQEVLSTNEIDTSGYVLLCSEFSR